MPACTSSSPARSSTSAISPSRTPTLACSPSESGSTVRTARQNVLSIVMPPPGMSHMHSATTPPGRVTRAISRAPASASRMNAITSEDSAASKPVVVERQVLRGAVADVGARVALAVGGGELRRRVDRGDVILARRARRARA